MMHAICSQKNVNKIALSVNTDKIVKPNIVTTFHYGYLC